MIHSFSCKNFYSFPDEVTIDFEVNDKVPKNNGYFLAPSNTRLSKVETVIGPNASGKTNLLKILPFLKWIITDSFNVNPSTPLPIKPFAFHKTSKEPSELSVNFEINEDIYLYDFILDDQKILREELKIKNKTKEKVTTKKLFVREWENKEKRYNFTGNFFDLPKGFENLLRTNASVIGTAMRLNHKKSQEIGDFWQKVQTNVVEAGWIGDHFFPNATANLINVLTFFSENEALKKEAEKLLTRFDLGFEAFDIKKVKNEGGFSIDAQIVHSFDSKKYTLPVQYESSGTKQLFILLKTILQVLPSGGVAIVDEFDVNLHPDMVLALFELFLSPETNPHNAQILFSTHSHRILNELDKYQIILIEKNEKGGSEAWRLDEMTGVRSDDNYYTKYITGAYGAIPNIY